jgi:hypothetical protein
MLERDPRIDRLERATRDQSLGLCRRRLAAAQLEILRGEIAKASTVLQEVLDRHDSELYRDVDLFAVALTVAVTARELERAAAIVNQFCRCDDWFELGLEDIHSAGHGSLGAVRWEIESRRRCRIWLPQQLVTSDRAEFMVTRLAGCLPLLAAYRCHREFETGSIFVSLDDIGCAPGLAFCDNRPNYFLVPDSEFIRHKGYAAMRAAVSRSAIPWEQRLKVAYWRGGTSGRPSDNALGWRSLPRIRLCRIGEAHRDLIDAGITHLAQLPDEKSEREVRDSGLMRAFAPFTDTMKFRYQIDIDGNTNSWPGLFQKLLTGSPVLKIASPDGYRQWYYDRLKPWVNFVPVRSDMADLVEKIKWLQTHDDTARQIGERGRLLAESLEYQRELARAGRTICAALRHFSDRAEVVLRFGAAEDDNAYLRDGWSVPEDGGVPALDWESRLELPRPVAGDNFMLTIDVSPVSGVAPQRLSVAANGEFLRQARLSSRQELRCYLPRATVERCEKLVITLLHPDAVQAASDSRPLDTRVLSVVLHRLELMKGGRRMAFYARAAPRWFRQH